MRIGEHEIAVGASLAPMAGGSDATMREICARFGAVFTISEMVSAKALTMGDKKSRQLLRGSGGAAPYGVQLFGNEPEVMGEAVRLIENEKFDFIDINMGCPAPKIVQGGSGSALMKDPALAEKIVQAVVGAAKKPVSVKMRIGWDNKTINGEEIALRCEAAGAMLVAVHARTRSEMYSPGVHMDEVAKIKKAVGISVVYNGDVCDAASAKEALRATGCDGVMVGRAAVGRPWVFAEIAAVLKGEQPPAQPTLYQRFAVLDEQVQALCARMGEDAGMRHARGVAAGYMQGLRGAAKLRYKAVALERYADLAELIASAYEFGQGE